MDGFARTIITLMVNAGVRPEYIFGSRGVLTPEQAMNSATALPGFYRATKDWDVVVVARGTFVAAVELKSQVGSFGNNFNNRVEEAVGNAADIWTAYRDGAFGTSSAPWLGYLFLLEDNPRVHTAVTTRGPHFPVFPEFVSASYARRYELLCRKLVRERQYSATCLLLSDPALAETDHNYSEPAEDLSGERFLAQLLAHAVAYASE